MARAEVEQLLQEASRQLAASGTRATILIDGLDEAEIIQQGAQPLFLPTSLPSCIRMVVFTRQRIAAKLHVDDPLIQLSIEPEGPENRADVNGFLGRMAATALAPLLASQNVAKTAFIESMAEASGGNFMYLRAVLNDILAENRVISDLRTLPRGLTDYYERHWNHILEQYSQTGARGRLLFPTLCVLSVAERPLSLAEMVAILGIGFPELGGPTTLDVLSSLQLWGQFLVREPSPDGDRYQIYHKSFHEFLNGKPDVSGELRRREAHDWIATAMMKEFLE